MPIDWSVALTRVEGDRQLLAELAAVFSQDYRSLLLEARKSISSGDHFGLERAAHTLKGRLAFFGMENLRDRALRLEIMGRTRSLSGAGECLTGIEADVERVIPEFNALSREYGK